MLPPSGSQMEHRHSSGGLWFLGILTMLLVMFIAGAGIFLSQRKVEVAARASQAEERIAELETDLAASQLQVTELETSQKEASFDEILAFPADSTFGYRGVAELRGYYATVEARTTLLDQPTTTCSAFIVVSGPEDVMSYMFNGDNKTIILGEVDVVLDSPWWNSPELRTSTSENPVTAVFRIGTKFEGEAVGCFDPRAEFIGTTLN